MSRRKIMPALTLAQAKAASNACDLIADSFRADGDKRGALIYARAGEVLDKAIALTEADHGG